MRSHDLARRLLAAPDCEVDVAMPEPAWVSLGTVASAEFGAEGVTLMTEHFA